MPARKSHTLIKSALVLGFATVITRMIGFGREIVLAAFYGAGNVSDAFILAFSIPDVLLFFVSFSATSGFIPTYQRVFDKTVFTRNIMTCLIIFGLLFSAVFTMIPGALVRVFAFFINEETFEIAVFFVRYMVWSAVFILLTAIYKAKLEIKGSFFSAGTQSFWGNIIIIAGIIAGATSGYNILVALAPVAGNALCVLVLASRCKKHGYSYRPYLNIKSPELRHMLLLIGPMFISTASNELYMIINRNFAASLPAGAISALNYSAKVQTLLAALIGSSVFTVLFPHMSKIAAVGDRKGVMDILSRSIVYIMAIVLPIGVGVVILAQPIVRVFFERGAFTSGDTFLTASCLRMYAFVIITHSINPLITRAFYAIQNAKAPAYASLATLLASVGLNFLLITPLGVRGLALSASFANMLATIILLILIRRKLGNLGLWSKLPEFAKMLAATGIMGVGVWLASGALPLMSATALQSLLLCAMLAFCAAAVYAALLLLLRSKTAFEAVGMVVGVIKKKR